MARERNRLRWPLLKIMSRRLIKQFGVGCRDVWSCIDKFSSQINVAVGMFLMGDAISLTWCSKKFVSYFAMLTIFDGNNIGTSNAIYCVNLNPILKNFEKF
jgi:hypothetical protein